MFDRCLLRAVDVTRPLLGYVAHGRGAGRGWRSGWSLLMMAMAMALATPAHAHDTWFQPLGSPGGTPLLSLGTGNRYPVQEFPIGAEQLAQRGCRALDGTAGSLSALRNLSKSLLLQARVVPAAAGATSAPLTATAPSPALSCWAQLVPFEVDLKPEVVELYLAEIAAPAWVRSAWADMQARGVGWHERFIKHARIELPGAADDGAAPAPSGMGLDAVFIRRPHLQTRSAAAAWVVQVLRDGQPLAGLPMELEDAQGRSGGWFTSDAQGRVQFPAPAAGRWVLRGTDLRKSDTQPDAWDSRFINLAFEVMNPPAEETAPRPAKTP